MSSLSRQQLEKYINELEIDTDRVLDIGGCQLPIKGRTKKWSVNEYLFLDLETPHVSKVQPDLVADINYDIEFITNIEEMKDVNEVALSLSMVKHPLSLDY